MKHREPRYPNKLLVIGTVTAVVGVVLLLATLGPLTLPLGLWPVPVVLAGLVFLYLAYVRGRAARYVLPGMLLTLGGLFFLLVETVLGWGALARAWPGLMLVTGLSLFAWGMRLKPKARTGDRRARPLHRRARGAAPALQPAAAAREPRRVRRPVVAARPRRHRPGARRFILLHPQTE